VSRPTTGPVSPANITISAKPVDSDGVTSASTTAVGSATELRYGRLRMLNTYGSERLALAIPLQAQYYDATINGFKHNTADSCTALSLPAVRTLSAAPPTDGVASRNFYPVVSGGNQLASSDTTATLPATLSSGAANMTLTAPLKRGWIDILLNVPPYLQGNWGNCWGQTGTAGLLDDMPCARATFGVYKSPLIYRRENY
jgi:MSHA biogenesis protein MshQ